MHTCFPDITSSLLRTHRHFMRQPNWATLKLQDDFSMRYPSLTVLHILHYKLNLPLQTRLSMCKLTPHKQLPERISPYKDNMQHENKVWGQYMAAQIISVSAVECPCWQQHDQATGNMQEKQLDAFIRPHFCC